MMRQLDGDGNVVLVMTKGDLVSLLTIAEAGGLAFSIGLARGGEDEVRVFDEIAAATYGLLSDEAIIEALIAPHLAHDDDPIDEMRAKLAVSIPKARASFVERGTLSA